MNFIIVDDNKTFRESLKFHLESTLNYTVLNEYEDGVSFLDSENIHLADIILMDIEMPKMNGIEVVKKALWENSFLKFIAVTSYTDKAYLLDLLGAGFKACVFKSSIFEELEKAIIAVQHKHFYFPGDINLEDNKS